MNYIRTTLKWMKILFILGLFSFIVFAMIKVNQDMDEHGFWEVYGEPDTSMITYINDN